MVREFKLPDVGEGLTEAEIVRWLVEPGDTVSEDQPVAEVETDKAVVEVPSPVNGTVREILAAEGEMVPVGEVIITFDVEGESPSASGTASGEQGEPRAGEADEGTESAGAQPDEPRDEVAGTDEGPVDAAGGDGASADTGGRVFAAPSARRLARELGVDIGAVDGSGPGGRVTEPDVRAAAESGPADGDGATAAGGADETATAAAGGGGGRSATRRVTDEGAAGPSGGADGASVAGESADRDRTLAAPATRRLAEEEDVDIDAVPTDETRDGEAFVSPEQVQQYAEAQQRAQAADAEAVAGGTASAQGAEKEGLQATGEDQRIPYRGVRRTIGQQMERSKYTAPHVTHHDEVDVTELVAVRGRLKEVAEERGVKLSYMPFVVKAVVAGLQEHPILNSQLDEEAEEIVVRGEYNVGVATATEAGLMVPVVKGADRKGMLEIAAEMNELVSKARERSISREEMQGGTFTLTNFGAIGGEYATPIINYPETAILGLGAIKDKPRVVEREAPRASEGASGEAASKEVVPRKVMTLSLSIDHRVVDGADAAQFVNTLKRYLADPDLLLLE